MWLSRWRPNFRYPILCGPVMPAWLQFVEGCLSGPLAFASGTCSAYAATVLPAALYLERPGVLCTVIAEEAKALLLGACSVCCDPQQAVTLMKALHEH